MKDTLLFLETTEDIFSSLDNFLETFMNDMSRSDRALIYRSSESRYLSDEVLMNYRSFVKQVTEECSINADGKKEAIAQSFQRAKSLINNSQPILEDINKLLNNKSDRFLGDDVEDLKEWIGCYIRHSN